MADWIDLVTTNLVFMRFGLEQPRFLSRNGVVSGQTSPVMGKFDIGN